MIFGSRKFRTDNSSEMLNSIFGYGAISKGMSSTWGLGRRLGQQYKSVGSHFQASSALNANRKDAIRNAFTDSTSRIVDSAAKRIAKGMQDAASALSDAALKKAVDTAREEMNRAASAARTLSDKQNALADAQAKLIAIAGRAKGADKKVLSGLAQTNRSELGLMNRGLQEQRINKLGLEINRRMNSLVGAIGSSTRILVPLKRTLDIGFRLFTAFNTSFNRFARMQMQIARERGDIGRRLHGSNVNYEGLMPLIGASRKAGLEDRDMLNKVVELQSQLAQERWGEGGLIDKYGKWGISVFDEEGRPKDADRLMLDVSDLLNSLSDSQERLHALVSLGYKPEQMDSMMNLRSEFEKFQKVLANPKLRGTLEDQRVFDKSGYYKRVDAATKIEEKRQEIINQNAIDEGPFAAIKRMMNPENWAFKDWTIRQRGVREARANAAKEKHDRGETLTAEELKDIVHYGDASKRNMGANFKYSDEFKERQRLSKELGIKFDIDEVPLEKLHSALTPITEQIADKIEILGGKLTDFLGRHSSDLIDRLTDAAKVAAQYAQKAWEFGKEALPTVKEFARSVLDFMKNPMEGMKNLATKAADTALDHPLTTISAGVGGYFGGIPGAVILGLLGNRLENSIFGNGGRYSEGGVVPGRKGEKGDKVLIRANPGELILNDDQQKQLEKLISGNGNGLKGYSNGGAVLPASDRARALEEYFKKNRSKGSGTSQYDDKLLDWGHLEMSFNQRMGNWFGAIGRGAGGFTDFMGEMGESFGDWLDVWGQQKDDKDGFFKRMVKKGARLVGKQGKFLGGLERKAAGHIIDAFEEAEKYYGDYGEDLAKDNFWSDIALEGSGQVIGGALTGAGQSGLAKGGAKLVSKTVPALVKIAERTAPTIGRAAVRSASATGRSVEHAASAATRAAGRQFRKPITQMRRNQTAKKVRDMRKRADALDERANINQQTVDAYNKTENILGGKLPPETSVNRQIAEMKVADLKRQANNLRQGAKGTVEKAPSNKPPAKPTGKGNTNHANDQSQKIKTETKPKTDTKPNPATKPKTDTKQNHTVEKAGALIGGEGTVVNKGVDTIEKLRNSIDKDSKATDKNSSSIDKNTNSTDKNTKSTESGKGGTSGSGATSTKDSEKKKEANKKEETKSGFASPQQTYGIGHKTLKEYQEDERRSAVYGDGATRGGKTTLGKQTTLGSQITLGDQITLGEQITLGPQTTLDYEFGSTSRKNSARKKNKPRWTKKDYLEDSEKVARAEAVKTRALTSNRDYEQENLVKTIQAMGDNIYGKDGKRISKKEWLDRFKKEYSEKGYDNQAPVENTNSFATKSTELLADKEQMWNEMQRAGLLKKEIDPEKVKQAKATAKSEEEKARAAEYREQALADRIEQDKIDKKTHGVSLRNGKGGYLTREEYIAKRSEAYQASHGDQKEKASDRVGWREDYDSMIEKQKEIDQRNKERRLLAKAAKDKAHTDSLKRQAEEARGETTQTSAAEGKVSVNAPSTDKPDAVKTMTEKGKAAESMSSTAATVQAGERAAASGGAATQSGAVGGNGTQTITITMGNQNINQTINGEFPIDENGIKTGTLQAASEIRDQTAEAIVSVTKCKGVF